MQRLQDLPKSTLRSGLSFNANQLMNGHQHRLQSTQQLSFANQFAKLKTETSQERDMLEASPMAEEAVEKDNTQVTQHSQSSFNTGFYDTKLSKQDDILKAIHKDALENEQESEAALDSSLHSNHKLEEQLSESEAVKATLAQAHQVDNAVKEGNVGEREAHHQHGNDRRKQLQNWEELAPSITEDIKNRAVRIDIPGLIDIETLIVRMQKNQVLVQAVGKDSVMEALQGREAELKSRLASKNIKLSSLQAFDAKKVKTGART